jgi:hypothetical protein
VRIIAPDLLIPVSPIQEKPNVKTLFKTPVLQAETDRWPFRITYGNVTSHN